MTTFERQLDFFLSRCQLGGHNFSCGEARMSFSVKLSPRVMPQQPEVPGHLCGELGVRLTGGLLQPHHLCLEGRTAAFRFLKTISIVTNNAVSVNGNVVLIKLVRPSDRQGPPVLRYLKS